jgi:hypothetical protein
VRTSRLVEPRTALTYSRLIVFGRGDSITVRNARLGEERTVPLVPMSLTGYPSQLPAPFTPDPPLEPGDYFSETMHLFTIATDAPAHPALVGTAQGFVVERYRDVPKGGCGDDDDDCGGGDSAWVRIALQGLSASDPAVANYGVFMRDETAFAQDAAFVGPVQGGNGVTLVIGDDETPLDLFNTVCVELQAVAWDGTLSERVDLGCK